MSSEEDQSVSVCRNTGFKCEFDPGQIVHHSRQTVHICGIARLPLKKLMHNNVLTLPIRFAYMKELQSAEVTDGAIILHVLNHTKKMNPAIHPPHL